MMEKLKLFVSTLVTFIKVLISNIRFAMWRRQLSPEEVEMLGVCALEERYNAMLDDAIEHVSRAWRLML
jgi:hypothetical protein